MKFASSMRHGGQWVRASDCDHDSYLKLGLCCPFCGNPVNLNQGRIFEGSAKRKAYQTEQYFCHFPGVAAEECELRSDREGKIGYKNSQAKAKMQRLKKFQSAIALILELNPRKQNWELVRKIAYRNFCFFHAPKQWKVYLQKNVGRIANCRAKIEENLNKSLDIVYQYLDYPGFAHLNYLQGSPLEQKLHSEICREAIAYLLSSSGKRDLLDLLSVIIYEISLFEDLSQRDIFSADEVSALQGIMLREGVMGLTRFPNLNKIINQKVSIELFYQEGIICTLVDYIATTPWASGFELLSESSKPQTILKSRLELKGFWVMYGNLKVVVGAIFLDKDVVNTEGVNLENWWKRIRLLSAFKRLYDCQRKINTWVIKKQPLPEPLNNFLVSAEICDSPNLYGYSSKIALMKNANTVAIAEFWLRLDDKQVYSKIKKQAKKNYHVTEYAYQAPGLYIASSSQDQYSSLLISLVAGYFTQLNLSLAEKINYLYPQLLKRAASNRN